jgi:hypothetical protein
MTNNVIWIDLDDAARWLSSKPDDVMCLIREGVLGSKRRPHEDFVVRADDVTCLAELWTPKTPKRRRARRGKTPVTSCERMSRRGDAGDA